jgi:ParB family chromosome partitioning protein
MARKIGEIEEPLHNYKQEILLIPIDELEVINIQRKPSKYHVNRLMVSIKKLGFITSLIVIKDDNYKIIDGQHRFLAAKELGIKEFLCLSIPSKYAYDLMELNIEKQPTLRERCYVALNVYRIYLNEDSRILEDDIRIMDSIEFPYYITLGLGYEKDEKLFGSAYESILKRVDRFINLPINEAYAVRIKRADTLVEIDNIAKKAVEKIKEEGIDHPFLHKEVVSYCNPIGRKRKVEDNIEEVFDKLRYNLEYLLEHPESFKA